MFVLALLALGWTTYWGSQRVMRDWRASQSAPEVATAATDASTSVSSYDISSIIDAHIFGKTEESARPKPAPAPETKLRLSLHGLVATSDTRFARAIIGVNGSKVEPYAVGQTIKGMDAKIHSIQPNRVLLDRNGALESLLLKRQTLGSLKDTALHISSEGAPGPVAEGKPTTRQGATEFRGDIRPKQMKLPF